MGARDRPVELPEHPDGVVEAALPPDVRLRPPKDPEAELILERPELVALALQALGVAGGR